jgi:hypothetical protein
VGRRVSSAGIVAEQVLDLAVDDEITRTGGDNAGGK